MPPTVRSQIETAASAESVFEPVCQLFAEVFGAPPLSRSAEALAAQRRGLRSLMVEPGFGMATAWDGEQLASFAYGHALNAQTHWWDNFLTPVASEITREWDGRTFAVIDMAVARSRQGAGVGRQLLDTLLESRPEERASLAVVHDNDQAHGFYRRLGWQHVGRVKGASHHTAPLFDMYVLRLR